jgi:protein TonB
MITPKLDLCKSEWLELVFDDRNKNYGAYDLRKHYADNLTKAIAITSLTVISLFVGYNIILKHQNHVVEPAIPYHPTVFQQPTTTKPPVTPPRAQESHPQTNTSTIKYPRLVPTIDEQATNPPKVTELEGATIGSETHKGDATGPVDIDPIDNTGGGGGNDAVTENTTFDMNTVEVMPEPMGGAGAWSKFLQKNLRYPSQAMDAGISGKVWVSFIVEKDGHLSNITVERGAGYGLDEEAARVLKLCPAWKPGIQNGHAVRVKFNLPINFQLNNDQ